MVRYSYLAVYVRGSTPFERLGKLREQIREAMRTGEWREVKTQLGRTGPRNTPIPGRNTTYGQEIERVVAETREQIVGSLNATQREQFGDTRIDPMVTSAINPKQIIGEVKREVAEEAAEQDQGGK